MKYLLIILTVITFRSSAQEYPSNMQTSGPITMEQIANWLHANGDLSDADWLKAYSLKQLAAISNVDNTPPLSPTLWYGYNGRRAIKGSGSRWGGGGNPVTICDYPYDDDRTYWINDRVLKVGTEVFNEKDSEEPTGIQYIKFKTGPTTNIVAELDSRIGKVIRLYSCTGEDRPKLYAFSATYFHDEYISGNPNYVDDWQLCAEAQKDQTFYSNRPNPSLESTQYANAGATVLFGNTFGGTKKLRWNDASGKGWIGVSTIGAGGEVDGVFKEVRSCPGGDRPAMGRYAYSGTDSKDGEVGGCDFGEDYRSRRYADGSPGREPYPGPYLGDIVYEDNYSNLRVRNKTWLTYWYTGTHTVVGGWLKRKVRNRIHTNADGVVFKITIRACN